MKCTCKVLSVSPSVASNGGAFCGFIPGYENADV